jgi:hypothetical protein
LGFELVIIGMLAHLSNHSTKSHPNQGYNLERVKGKKIKRVCAPIPCHSNAQIK